MGLKIIIGIITVQSIKKYHLTEHLYSHLTSIYDMIKLIKKIKILN